MRNIIFFLLFYISISSAKTFSDEELKIAGRALANYQVCSEISSEMGDSVMLSYYSEMYSDSLRESKNHPKIQSDIVFNEQQSSTIKLAKLDRKNLGELCLSRFDPLSRKMQENKLAGK